MEASFPPSLSPLFLISLLAENSYISHLSIKSSILRLVKYIILSSFLFILRLFPSSLAFPCKNNRKQNSENYSEDGKTGDSAIARALSQLLSIVNGVPVSSRKYEIVRSLAERIIEDNLLQGSEVLREVNCTVLSSAFDRTLSQLESAVLDQGRDPNRIVGNEGVNLRISRLMRVVQYCGDMAWAKLGGSGFGESAEKLAAEALWLAQKMAACGCVNEAVFKWASAKRLAWLSLSAEPRLQSSLVKVSAYLFKHAKNLGQEEEEENKKEQQRQTKMRILISWLPLLCRASNGTDAPVMSISERAELEGVLEQIIGMLNEEEQEKVLSLWVHHFTYCPSSDWPNLYTCYSRWCAASRKRLLFQ